MKTPFPSMDPWLEGHVWPDVQHGLASIIKMQIVPQVSPNYYVRIQPYSIVDPMPLKEEGILYPFFKRAKTNSLVSNKQGQLHLTPATLIVPRPTIKLKIPVVVH